MKEVIERYLPTYGEKNIAVFYIIRILTSGWFNIGNWLIFVLLFMSERQFAVIEALAFLVGLLIEIPSGAIADLLGRKRTMILATFLQALGIIIFTLGGVYGYWWFFVGNITIIAAFAFRSGTLEALAYDTLVESGKEKYYEDIIGKSKSLIPLTIVVVGLIGGLAWTYNEFLPSILTAIVFTFGFIASFWLREPNYDKRAFTWKNFITQNKRGFAYLFTDPLKKYTYSFFVIMASFLMWDVGIIRTLMGRDFGYGGDMINYMTSLTLIVGFIGAYNFSRIRNYIGDHIGFTLVLLIASIAWIFSALFVNAFWIGVGIFVAIAFAGHVSEAWISVIINKQIKSEDRATAISTLAFFVQIPYVFVVFLFSGMVEDGTPAPFYLAVGLLLFVGAVVFYGTSRSAKL